MSYWVVLDIFVSTHTSNMVQKWNSAQVKRLTENPDSDTPRSPKATHDRNNVQVVLKLKTQKLIFFTFIFLFFYHNLNFYFRAIVIL